MMTSTMLAGSFPEDMQTIVTVALGLFALFTGLIWAGVIYLRSIARSLRSIADRNE